MLTRQGHTDSFFISDLAPVCISMTIPHCIFCPGCRLETHSNMMCFVCLTLEHCLPCEAKSLHLFGLFCVPFCALACRGTVRLPLTLSVLRMWMWNHLHTVFVSRLFVLVISPGVHGAPDLGQIVFANCIVLCEVS